MTVVKGDTIFARGGVPVLVTSKNEVTGEVTYTSDFEKVQKENKNSVRNGLDEATKAQFQEIVTNTGGKDVKESIRNLAEKIRDLKKEPTNPRLLRYLQGELQYLMTRERYQPEDYEVDRLTLESY